MGLALIAGFSRIVLNKKLNTYTKISGIIIPLKSKTVDLPKATELQFKTKHERNTDSDGHTTYTTYYPVYMVGKKGQGKEIIKTTNLLKSRKASEEIAKLFKLKIVDTSLGLTIKRSYKTIDDNIKTTLLKNKEKVQKPKPPAHFAHKVKSTVNKYGEQASEISFGRRFQNNKGPFFISLSLFIVFSSYLAYCYLGLDDASGEVKLLVNVMDHFSIPVLISGLIDFICLRGVLRGLIGSKISISTNKIYISNSLVFPITRTINMNELEHCLKRITFQADRIGKITLITDSQFIETAYEEPEEILDYIVELIKFKAQ